MARRARPEFGTRGKERVTIRHLLTHTGGFRGAATSWAAAWDEIIDRICQSPLEPGLGAGQEGRLSHLVELVHAWRTRAADRPPAIRPVRARGDLPSAGDARQLGGDSERRVRELRPPARAMYDTQKGEWDAGSAGNNESSNTIRARRERPRALRELAMLYECCSVAGGAATSRSSASGGRGADGAPSRRACTTRRSAT